jgi:uncharacterized protein (TIGR00288 family)
MEPGMNGQPKVVLLIDADNVSIDVIEQAVAHLLAEYGALHVRRAYGTAESAVKNQATFKRLGIRPMVNLSTGKNSTDIALAVDAMDLVVAERPDLVAIASSDSDFAPLVARLREKGCRVVGLGQAGKTGDETVAVYDLFTVLTHRKGTAPARSTARRGSASTRSAPAPAPVSPPPSPSAPVAPAVPRETSAAPATPAAKTPRAASRGTARSGARKTATRKSALPAAAPVPAAPAAEAAPVSAAAADKMAQVLAALPELGDGKTVELRLAAERPRDAGLIGRSGSSTRVFGAFPETFELLPAKNPNKVRLRG